MSGEAYQLAGRGEETQHIEWRSLGSGLLSFPILGALRDKVVMRAYGLRIYAEVMPKRHNLRSSPAKMWGNPSRGPSGESVHSQSTLFCGLAH